MKFPIWFPLSILNSPAGIIFDTGVGCGCGDGVGCGCGEGVGCGGGIGSFERISSEFVGSYIHAGNKIATIVGLSNSFDGASEVAKNVSMQAAAMNPVALDENGVSKDVIEKEIEIAKDQLRAEGKPEAMLDNIAKGKLKKFF